MSKYAHQIKVNKDKITITIEIFSPDDAQKFLALDGLDYSLSGDICITSKSVATESGHLDVTLKLEEPEPLNIPSVTHQ